MSIIIFESRKRRHVRIENTDRFIAVRQELGGVSISVAFSDTPQGDRVEQVRKMLIAAYENNYEKISRLPQGGVQ